MPDRPNLLFLFPDQWRWDWLGHAKSAYGDPPVRTPNSTASPRGAPCSPSAAPTARCAPRPGRASRPGADIGAFGFTDSANQGGKGNAINIGRDTPNDLWAQAMTDDRRTRRDHSTHPTPSSWVSTRGRRSSTAGTSSSPPTAPRLYDLADDPLEQHNIAADHPDTAARLQQHLPAVSRQ